ncbi:MAG: LysR family transcriptional regulator [Anaerolineae bacterium]|nr:LysR family transcriptional regulator [Anaerolineae bacterium]
MELRQVQYFVEVARRLSFTNAAEELGVAQPALSQQIRGLERELGVTLLDRTSRRVALTDAGGVFLRRAEQLMADAHRARLEMREFSGLAQGKVTIGVVPNLGTVWLAQLLSAFHKRYPGIEIILAEDTTMDLLNALNGGQLDLALLHDSSEGMPERITTYPLFSEELVLGVSPDHPLALRSKVSLNELRDESWIMIKMGSIIRQSLHTAMAAAGFSPRIVCETGSSTTICALVSAGLGISILPRSIFQTAATPVSIVDLVQPMLTRTITVAWRTNVYHSAVATAFVAFARDGENYGHGLG